MMDIGLLQPLLEDETVSKIMVNGPDQVYVERHGQLLQRVEVSFENNDHIIDVINQLLRTINDDVQLSPDHPYATARFSDGSRLQAFIPPIAVSGPNLTIHKASQDILTLENLLTFGSFNQEMADFFRACVQARLNIVVAGGVNSGKTTLFNAIASTIPAEERIVTIEETAEFRLQHQHVITLESRPANRAGQGEISVRDLLQMVPRARPDRILIGELRGPEVLAALRLMDQGYDGTMTLMFADNPQEALERLEMMIKLDEPNLPASYLRALISSTVDLVVQLNRLEDGSRKVTRITEVLSLGGGDYDLHDVFVYQREGFDRQRKRFTGRFESHPVSVNLMQRMEARGITLPPSLVVPTDEG
jgi:pilus assembly protein CpaF